MQIFKKINNEINRHLNTSFLQVYPDTSDAYDLYYTKCAETMPCNSKFLIGLTAHCIMYNNFRTSNFR